MRRTLSQFVAAGLLAAFVAAPAALAESANADGKEHVVIQVSDDNPKNWNQALNVASNLQNAYGEGKAVIELVAFGMGINMLKDDAVVANRVRDASSSGVRVYACENSMARFKLKRDDMISAVSYVKTGVVHIIKRQREGWATVRP